jgi:hypothetical protein
MVHTSLGPIEISFLNPENYYSYKVVQLFESIVIGKDGKVDYYVGIDISLFKVRIALILRCVLRFVSMLVTQELNWTICSLFFIVRRLSRVYPLHEFLSS